MSRNGWILLTLGVSACGNDYEVQEQTRILTTEQATFEPNIVAVNDRETVNVYLASVGQAPVTVYNVTLEVTEGSVDDWVILDTWKTKDTDGDGVNDAAEIAGGSEEDPTYHLVEVNYRPQTAGRSRAILSIESNDNEVVERVEGANGKDNGIWKVAVRGVAQYPCAIVYPIFHDFGPHPAGSYWNEPFTIENCGNVTLTVTSYDLAGDASFYLDTVFQFTVLAGSTKEFNVAWEPGGDTPESADVTLITNSPTFDQVVSVIGNDCESSVDSAWDADSDGWPECGGDCDDRDASVSPETPEDDGNGIDDDCDGSTDESLGLARDNDEDGVTENDGDCNDNDATIYPGATETVNQRDDDCDDQIDEGSERYDDDKDGFSEREGDCDDSDDAIYPGATEEYDTVDNNCDDTVDEDSFSYDDDEDGYPEVGLDGSTEDCDDDDPWTYPAAQEDCDEVDNDCDGLIDEGEDDTPDGACAFIVEREEVTVVDSGKGGCSTGGAGAAAGGLALALAGLISRRRTATRS